MLTNTKAVFISTFSIQEVYEDVKPILKNLPGSGQAKMGQFLLNAGQNWENKFEMAFVWDDILEI